MKKVVLMEYFDVNCYIVDYQDSCFVIDPGCCITTLKKEIGDLKVVGILLTHGHADHTDLIGEFNCPIYIHEADIELLKNPNISCHAFFGIKPKFDYKKLDIHPLRDGDVIPFFDREFKVIYTPGHTIGSVSYLYRDKLFSGDTLFYHSIGRTDLPTGNPSLMKSSVNNLIDTLDDTISVYPGHDRNTTIKEERKNNPYYSGKKRNL